MYSCPSVVHVYGVYTQGDQNYMGYVADYYEHGDLRNLVINQTATLLSDEQKSRLLLDIAEVMHEITLHHSSRAFLADLLPRLMPLLRRACVYIGDGSPP